MKEEATTLPQQFIKKYRLLLGEESTEFFVPLSKEAQKRISVEPTKTGRIGYGSNLP